MSDAAITNVVTGIVTIATLIVGLLSIWIKLYYAGTKAQIVEDKLDDNTRTTNAVDGKADTLVQQTNGVVQTLQASVDQLLNRVEKLEDYNRSSAHRLLDAVNAVHVRLAEMSNRPIPKEPPIGGE